MTTGNHANQLQVYDPANDYLFSAYELYNYSKSDHQKILVALTKLDFVKQQLGESYSPLEAAVLVSLLAAKEKFQAIVSLTPNYLVDIIQGLSLTQIIQNASCYYGSSPVENFNYPLNFSVGNFPMFLEFAVDVSLITDCITADSLVLATEQQIAVLTQADLDAAGGIIVISGESSGIDSYNLLECFIKAQEELANSKAYVRVSERLARSQINSLTLYRDQLLKRCIFSSEELQKIQGQALNELSEERSDFSVPVLPSQNPSELNLWAAFLSKDPVVFQLTKENASELLRLASFPERFCNELQLTIEVSLLDLTVEAFNLLLPKCYQQGSIRISYANWAASLDESKSVSLDIKFSDFSLPPELSEFYQKQSDSLVLEGEDLTILTWGRTAIAVNNWCLGQEDVAPEVIILSNLTEPDLLILTASLKKTSKLAIVPDPTLDFPLVDVLINKFHPHIFNYLELPVQVVKSDQLGQLVEICEL